MLSRESDRQILGRRVAGSGKMGSGDDDRLSAGDKILVDVAFVERTVGTIIAIEDERKGFVVANAQDDQRRQTGGVGMDAGDGDALAGALLADVATHMFVADARDEAAFQTEPRRADGDIGRATADRLGKARHIFKAPANLRAVEVDRRTADGDNVEVWLRHERQFLV
jgi:hypothetical protein